MPPAEHFSAAPRNYHNNSDNELENTMKTESSSSHKRKRLTQKQAIN
jgi:hypothetical protein